ncbi:MAG: YcaO-like family protein [Undibacterium sp.]|nr:YcaO-like family protein [Undibacterium sp.]
MSRRPRPLPGSVSVGVIERQFDLLVNEHLGVVRRLTEVFTEPGTPNFFHYAAEASNTSAFSNQRNFFNTGGAGINRSIAIAKAVGEAVERYCAALYDAAELPFCSARDASFECTDPAAFALHSEAQYQIPGFPWAPWNADTALRWTPARAFSSQRIVYVPAAFCWIPYHYDPAIGEAPIGQPISTGLACHADYHRAVLSGLCEVIERDAFTIFWQRGLAMPQIRIETLSDANYDRVQRFEVTGDRVILLNLTLDHGVPVVLSILESQQEARPAFVFAAACDPDPERATAKALEELAHTRRYSHRVHTHLAAISPDNDYEQVRNQMDHLNLAGDHRNRSLIDFALSSRQRQSFDDIVSLASDDQSQTVARVVAQVEATGHEVLVAELTSEDIAQVGLTVVRVMVPGYHPLFMGHQWRALGGERLWNVPEKLGLSTRFARGGDNPIPHPYP